MTGAAADPPDNVPQDAPDGAADRGEAGLGVEEARQSATDPLILPAETHPVEDGVTLTIDGHQITVPEGELVIRAAERVGITIPRFCDHPLLDPAGACRQCIVEIEGQAKPMTSCTTPVADDMVVKTHVTSETARAAQEAQLEFLLINHPLDCPMCDKGGECPLQDQALDYGPGESRFIDEKRRYAKPVAVSPNVLLDRERCVLCARCTRFAKQISGDPFIELFERGALQQVAIYEDEPYQSYFSGNVIQICPVGALTSASYRFRARPFDLQSRPSVCNRCSAGCNLNVHTRRGGVERQLARTNMAVNEAWNCDKGRFGFKYLDHRRRLVEPAVRRGTGDLGDPAGAAGGDLVGVSWTEALDHAAEALSDSRAALLTGGHLADEDAYAAGKFARTVLGTNDVDFRTWEAGPDEDDSLAVAIGGAGPTYADIERAEIVLLVGLDPEEEVPILYLRLRKAWREQSTRLVSVGPRAGSIVELLSHRLPTAPGGEAAVLDRVADRIGPDAPNTDSDTDSDSAGALATELAQADGRVVILVGERGAASPGALAAAGRLGAGLGAKLAWVPRRNNARGAVEAGLAPNLLPGGRRRVDDEERAAVEDVWGGLPDRPGRSLVDALEAAAADELDVLYLVGVDLVGDSDRPELVRDALDHVDTVIAQDLLHTDTVDYADIVLPAAAPHERDGTFTNWEGRRQRFRQAIDQPELIQEDWDIFVQLAATLGGDLGFTDLGGIRDEIARLGSVEVSRRWPDRDGDRPAADSDRPSPGDDASAAGAGGGRDGFDLVTSPLLLDGGAMSAGADDMLAAARRPFVAVNDADAAPLGITDGDPVVVTGSHGELTLPARVETDVAAGVVYVPSRLLPADGEVSDDAPTSALAALGSGDGRGATVSLARAETS